MRTSKSYTELSRFLTFEDRYNYLRMGGVVGAATFGHLRFINQNFYTSRLWRSIRDEVILRDNGCDLGILDREIHDKIIIHHMNVITEDDIQYGTDFLLSPEFLVCVSTTTHNAIHYGDENLLLRLPIVRRKNDTTPWR